MQKTRVVITGMGSISAIGKNADETWESVVNCKTGIDAMTVQLPGELRFKNAAEVKNYDPYAYFSSKELASLDRFAQFEKSKGKILSDLLVEFEEARAKSLSELRSWNLTDEQLQLKGMHPELGEVTLSQLLATWVVHDLNHIRQIATSMAKLYDAGVGPWKEYLSILK